MEMDQGAEYGGLYGVGVKACRRWHCDRGLQVRDTGWGPEGQEVVRCKEQVDRVAVGGQVMLAKAAKKVYFIRMLFIYNC